MADKKQAKMFERSGPLHFAVSISLIRTDLCAPWQRESFLNIYSELYDRCSCSLTFGITLFYMNQ